MFLYVNEGYYFNLILMKPCSDDDVRLSCNSLENSRNTIKLGDCNFPCTLSLRQPNKSGSEQSVGNANEVII